jgi:hypothetical protein
MSIKQISVFVENKPGAMSAMTAVLAENNVDMRALSLAETADFGIVRIIVDNIYNATTVLKDAGYIHSVTDVLAVAIPNVPGGVNKVLTVLENAGINIEYMYAFLGKKEKNHAYMIFRVQDDALATKALMDNNIRSLNQADVENF